MSPSDSDSEIFEADIGLFMFAWNFTTSWPKMRVLGQNRGGWYDIDPNKLVLIFGGYYLCANFSENRPRSVTVRVPIRTDANWFYNLSHAIA